MPLPISSSAEPEAESCATQDASSGFAQLINAMGSIRENATVIADPLGVAAESSPDRQNELAHVARQTRVALGPLADEGGLISRIRQGALARRLLQSLRSRSVALKAIASLSRLTARSMGSSNFDDYTDGLTRKSAELSATTDRVIAALDSVTAHISSSGAAAQDAVYALDALLATGGDADRSMDAQTAQVLVDASIALRDRFRTELNGLVSLMQFSDEHAQRMDHIATLSGTNGLSILAAAQLEALAQDTEATLGETQARMTNLSHLATEATGHFRDTGLAAQMLEAAKDRHAAFADSMQEAASVSRAAAIVRVGLEILNTATVETSSAFADLRSQSEDIGLSAINSSLLARGDERTSRAMTNLAAAVGEHARETSVEISQCRDLIEGLTSGNAEIATSILEQANALERALSDARVGLSKEQELAEKRVQNDRAVSDSISALGTALAHARDALEALHWVPDQLKETAVAQRQKAEVPDGDAAGRVRTIYTMQRERDVHDAATGRVPPVDAPPDAPVEQDLDDIFF